MIRNFKNQNVLATLLIFGLLFTSLTACEKESDLTPTDNQLTTEETVDILEGALAVSTQGLAAEAADAADLSDKYVEKSVFKFDCGQTLDSTVTRNYQNERISAQYTALWQWTVHCNNQQLPTALDFGRQVQGSYASNRLQVSDEAESQWSINQLILGPYYVLNGSYDRTGTQTSLVREQRSFTSSIRMDVSSLNISKGTRRIESGQAAFTLTGEVSTGERYEIVGQIIFTGNGTATVIINRQQYTIDIS